MLYNNSVVDALLKIWGHQAAALVTGEGRSMTCASSVDIDARHEGVLRMKMMVAALNAINSLSYFQCPFIIKGIL